MNDETVINSLSALESGKIDEIVSKTTMAREGGFTGEARIPGAALSAGGGKNLRLELKRRWFVPGHVFRYLMLGINC